MAPDSHLVSSCVWIRFSDIHARYPCITGLWWQWFEDVLAMVPETMDQGRTPLVLQRSLMPANLFVGCGQTCTMELRLNHAAECK
jgi:hypothetical protein